MTNYCVCCGADVPEGRQTCPVCEGLNRDKYINEISELSDHYGNRLVELMDRCGVSSLRDVSEGQARRFLEEMKRK